MELKLLILGGYGQFVWPAFIFTFVSFFLLYIKTKNELKKLEKVYMNELEQILVTKRNGRGKESLNIDKIHSMVGFATEGITGVSASYVEMNSGIQFFDGITTEDIQQILIKSAIESIPEDPFTYETWDIWTKSINEKTGLKGRNLFMPLRLILTGRDKGPELKNFLPLLDKPTLLRKFGKT